MSEDKPKVVNLSGRPYEAPPKIEIDATAIDRGSILQLQDVIERFESGEFFGCIVMPWVRDERRFENIICIPPNEDISEAALKYAGGLQLMNEDVLNLHLYGDVDWEDPEDEE